MMEKVFTGELISYDGRVNVDDRIVEGIPATFSLCIGAAVIWMFFGILFGYLSAVRAGGWLDRALTVVAVAGISIPVFCSAAIFLYYLTYKIELFPAGGYVAADRRPARVGLPPDPALDHAGDPLHRLLQPRAALEHARRDERGLRAHRPRQGARRAPGDDPPRAAQLADPDRHPVRARLRRDHRRRRDHHRSDLQPRRRRPVRRRIARPTSTCRRSWRSPSSAPSSSSSSTPWSTSPTPTSTRGSGWGRSAQ